MLVVAALGVMSAFGGFFGGSIYSPVHDGGSAKTLEVVEYEGYEQQKNDGSGTRQTIGQNNAEAAPQVQEAQEEARELIDVSRHDAPETQTATEKRSDRSGNISVLAE